MDNNGAKIAKELLFEYNSRIIRLLTEPRVSAFQDSPEMQEIFKKIHTLLSQEILRFEDEEHDDVGKPNLTDVMQALTSKNKIIYNYMRKMAELELRKQIMRSTQGYSQCNMAEINVPGQKVKAYMNNGS
jgi:hypothetical protein